MVIAAAKKEEDWKGGVGRPDAVSWTGLCARGGSICFVSMGRSLVPGFVELLRRKG